MLTPTTDPVKGYSHTVCTLEGLHDSVTGQRHLYIAADTEFEGPHTLTAQFAMRLGDKIAVQIYRSQAVEWFQDELYLWDALPKNFNQWCEGIVVREVKSISQGLSPARVLADLLDLPEYRHIHRNDADEKLPEEVEEPFTLTFIAHFWPADFFRVFGKRFFHGLVVAQKQEKARLIVKANKLLAFREVGRGVRRFDDPILEFLQVDDKTYPLKVKTFDTSLPFGKGSLDSHAKTFLNLSKLESITREDKEHMRKTFREKTLEALLYAMLDPILTLLVHERMREEDRKMYLSLGFEEDEVPILRPTQGWRVAEMMTKVMAKYSAQGAINLTHTGKPLKDGGVGKVSLAKVTALLRKGSGEFIAEENLSHFGKQTGETHGGLLFSRSPDKFLHEAPGMFRDADFQGCYNAIIGSMKMYAGRPVIHEPGSGKMTLKDAVAFVKEHAAGKDAWIIKVTGKITKCPNTLILSTNDALTNANYQDRRARQRAKARRYGFVFDWLYEPHKQTGHSTLFTEVIEGGIIAWSTWLMIQAMPSPVRQEYEQLEVDTILLYPEKLVARNGEKFDALVDLYATGKTPWSTQLDMEELQKVTVEEIDADYVSLEFDVGTLARKIGVLRKEAKEKEGKGCGRELAWKQHGNTMYGVCASPHLVTNNVICANIITATARALAFAMQMSLNGVQVITDGCTYRRDQIPACTFAECLQASADYPLRRVESGVPFTDPKFIPNEDAKFTAWYREHVKDFFQVSGPEYDHLFSIHGLEHKECETTQGVAFDGLCCDGSGNYLKLLKKNGEWKVDTFKARSFKPEAKEKLIPWILETYVHDNYQGPPPFTEMLALVTYKQAVQLARAALAVLESHRTVAERQADPLKVLFPLGLDQRKILAYKVIKPSAFLFKNPEQRKRICKAMKDFGEVYACGLELLALRRGPNKGSLTQVAERLYEYIRQGGDNLTKAFNLTRKTQELERVRVEYAQVIEKRKRKLRKKLFRTIDAQLLSPDARNTGLFLSEQDIIRVE